MPGRSISSAKSSSEHLNERQRRDRKDPSGDLEDEVVAPLDLLRCVGERETKLAKPVDVHAQGVASARDPRLHLLLIPQRDNRVDAHCAPGGHIAGRQRDQHQNRRRN